MPLLLDDRRQPLFSVLTKSLKRLQKFPLDNDSSSMTTQREVAAFLHSVILYDHPTWMDRHPEGFTDGLCVYLSADHVEALERDSRPSQAVPNLYHVLAMAFDDLVNQYAFPERPHVGLPRVSREEVVHLLHQVEMSTGSTPEVSLSTALDPHAEEVLHRFYTTSALTSWDVGPLVEGVPSTEHGFDSLHPVNRLHRIARINTLGDHLVDAWTTHLADPSARGVSPAIEQASQSLAQYLVKQDLDTLSPAMFALGQRLHRLENHQNPLLRPVADTQVRRVLVQTLGLTPGFTEEIQKEVINGLSGMNPPAGTGMFAFPRTFKTLDLGLSQPALSGEGLGVAESLSGNPMAVAVAAANGYTVAPVLDRCIGDASTPAQQDWRDRYVYALPHAWVNFPADARSSSRSNQEDALRWRLATRTLPEEQARLALQGVKLLSMNEPAAWLDLWSVHQQAAVEPTARTPATSTPGPR